MDQLKESEHMNLIDRALIYAAEAHPGVTRKGTKVPYIFHCSETAAIVADMTDDEDVIAAAVLHDIVENTEHTIDNVIFICCLCTFALPPCTCLWGL